MICGYGPDETSVPDAVKDYVLARVREQYAPPRTPNSPFLKLGLEHCASIETQRRAENEMTR